jgi:hypothetical protein
MTPVSTQNGIEPGSCSLLQRRVSNIAHRAIGHCSRPFCHRNWECQCIPAHHAAKEATAGRKRLAPRGSALVPYALGQLAHESRASASPARDGCRFHEAGRKPLPLGSRFAPREPPWRRERRSWLVARGSWLVARGSWLVARGVAASGAVAVACVVFAPLSWAVEVGTIIAVAGTPDCGVARHAIGVRVSRGKHRNGRSIRGQRAACGREGPQGSQPTSTLRVP